MKERNKFLCGYGLKKLDIDGRMWVWCRRLTGYSHVSLGDRLEAVCLKKTKEIATWKNLRHQVMEAKKDRKALVCWKREKRKDIKIMLSCSQKET